MNLKNPPEHYGTFNNHPTKGGQVGNLSGYDVGT